MGRGPVAATPPACVHQRRRTDDGARRALCALCLALGAAGEQLRPEHGGLPWAEAQPRGAGDGPGVTSVTWGACDWADAGYYRAVMFIVALSHERDASPSSLCRPLTVLLPSALCLHPVLLLIASAGIPGLSFLPLILLAPSFVREADARPLFGRCCRFLTRTVASGFVQFPRPLSPRTPTVGPRTTRVCHVALCSRRLPGRRHLA